jgi:ubiquinone/menaquinone biosynthesis C-methylase UbiE
MNQDIKQMVIKTYNKIASHYSNAYFEDLSDAPFIDSVLQKISQNARILDIGCGPGTYTEYIHKKGFSVEGIDISDEMITIARSKIPDASFKKMDMRKLDYSDHSFDLLLLSFSLIHIPTKEINTTLKELSRVLKKGGKIAIIVQKGKPDQFVTESFMPSEKMFFNFFTIEKLKMFLEKAHFTIESVEEKPTLEGEGLTDAFIYVVAHT